MRGKKADGSRFAIPNPAWLFGVSRAEDPKGLLCNIIIRMILGSNGLLGLGLFDIVRRLKFGDEQLV